MTNRQWLEGLDDEEFITTLQRFLWGYEQKDDECPPDRSWNCNSNCTVCWVKWLRAESDKPTTAFYDIVEEHHNCTVQVLKNSVTGEISVGWKEERDEPPKTND